MQKYFIEQAHSYAEAERKAREKYGEHLTILMHETVKIPGGFLNLFSREGVKLTGIIPSRFRAGQVRESQPQYMTKPAPQAVMPVRRELLSAQKGGIQRAPSVPKEPLDFAAEKEKLLSLVNTGRDNALKEVLAEVRTIKDKLENSGLQVSREEHPTLNMIDDLLIFNDFSIAYRKSMMERIRKEISLEGLKDYDAVQDKVLDWIGESVKVFDDDKFRVRPRIMILVGPTGVGKTTTVAKLAANFGLDGKGGHKRRVVLITIDAYRIGAKEQLEKYSGWMEFPFFSTSDFDELKNIIDSNSENTDLILIDTIGKNPRDMVELGKMKMLLDACGSLAEVHLVTASTTKSSDLGEILQQFESFKYRSVIVTKMDETKRTGNIISVLAEKNKSVSYVTNGQTVPTDIKKASVIQFLTNLEGFRVNRAKLEEKFPDKSQNLMQRWK